MNYDRLAVIVARVRADLQRMGVSEIGVFSIARYLDIVGTQDLIRQHNTDQFELDFRAHGSAVTAQLYGMTQRHAQRRFAAMNATKLRQASRV